MNIIATISQVDSTQICIVYDFDCTITYAHFSLFTVNINKFLQNDLWIPKSLEGLTDPIQIIERIKQLSQTVIDAVIRFNTDPLQLHISDRDKNTFIELIFGPNERIQNIKASFNHLIRNGCDLYISSRGDCLYVKWCLRVFDMENIFKHVNAYQWLGVQIPYDQRNKELDACKQHGNGKVDFITNHLMQQYNNVIYIDDDHKEHHEISSKLDYQQHVDKFVSDLRITIAPMYTHYDVVTDLTVNYFFINTLTKEKNGIGDSEIWRINEIVRRIRDPNIPDSSSNCSQGSYDILGLCNEFNNDDYTIDELDKSVEFVGGYLKETNDPTYHSLYMYYRQLYLDEKYKF
jgi:hypothetical protein